MRRILYIICSLSVYLCLYSACTMVERPDGGDNGEDPPPTARFENVTFSNLPTQILGGNNWKAIATDLNNDDSPDLIIASGFAPNIILLNDGSGVFSNASNVLPARNGDTKDMAVADYENDGDTDIFFANQETNVNEFYLNFGGSFNDLTSRIPVSGESTSSLATDIDNDGDFDILIGNDGQNVLLINNSNAFFANENQRIPQVFDITQDVAVGDLTGEGNPDIVVGNSDDNRILINIGNGFFNDQTANRLPLLTVSEDTENVELADVDGDGDLDIYFANVSFQLGFIFQDRLLLNDGNGIFNDVTEDQLPVIDTNTFAVKFTDIDIDGDADIVHSSFDGGLSIFINDGSGVFTDETDMWIPENFTPRVTDIEVADFDGDGLLDIYLTVFQGTDRLLLQIEI